MRALAEGGQDALALRHLREKQRLLLRAGTPHDRWRFLTHVLAAVTLVAADEPVRPVALDVVPARTVTELATWLRREAEELGRAFDERDRSDAFAHRLEEAVAARRAPRPLDLGVVPEGAPPPAVDTVAGAGEAGAPAGERGSSDPEALVAAAEEHARRGEHEEAVRLFLEAGGAAATLRSTVARHWVAAAAHSFWLAGRVLVRAGQDEEAVYHLESALEGFLVARRQERAHVADELVEVLRRLGRPDDAEAVAARLRG